jgi:hypothetical protein
MKKGIEEGGQRTEGSVKGRKAKYASPDFNIYIKS